MLLRARQFEFRFPRPALVMGIVNVTPDSFSDGGRFLKPEAAVAHALDLVAQGADIVDIGGESTRPGAEPVSAAEEMRRVLPVIEALADQVQVPLSIDTMKPAVARAALAAGASLVNDVAASHAEPGMWRLAADVQAGYVCMHMRGTPATMQRDVDYADVLGEVAAYFAERLRALTAAGIVPEQVIVDPGIGFGKGPDHNLNLLASLSRLTRFERPVLVGASRKSFIGKVLGVEVAARLAGSLACACWAAANGAAIIRAHDVAETVQAVRMTEALQAHRT